MISSLPARSAIVLATLSTRVLARTKRQQCRCTPAEVRRYVNKLSGPLLDRIDIHIEVDGIGYDELRGSDKAESSADIKARVEQARAVQRKRYAFRLKTVRRCAQATLRPVLRRLRRL